MKNYILVFALNSSEDFTKYAKTIKNLGYKSLCLKNDYYNNSLAEKLCDKVIITSLQNVYNPLKAFDVLKKEFDVKKICAVIPLDRISMTSLYIKDQLGIKRGMSTPSFLNCIIKPEMRKILNSKTKYKVWYKLINDPDDLKEQINDIKFPCFLKPAKGAGSEMVAKINSKEELIDKYQHFYEIRSKWTPIPALDNLKIGNTSYNLKTCFMVEELLEGREASFEGFSYNNKMYKLGIRDKIAFKGGIHNFENELFTPPLNFTDKENIEIDNCINECLSALNYNNNVFHIEFLYTKNGPRILEINPRNGGADVPGFMKLYTNICLKEKIVELSVGTPLSTSKINFKPYLMGVILYPDRAGMIKEIIGLDKLKKLPEVKKINTFYKIGDQVETADREIYLGAVFLQSNDKEKLFNLSKKIQKTVKYIIE